MWDEIILFEFLLLAMLWKPSPAGAGMPLIQINHDGDDYPEMQEEVHLADFFWTGSGDGPPDYLKKVHTGISKGKEVIVKTETVVATVYVDGNNEVDIPICVDCYPGLSSGSPWGRGGVDVGGFGGTELPTNYSAADRRYWLLTVMSGFYTQRDNPLLEEKLSRLYRLAFTRQQSRHLGINGAQQISRVVNQNEGSKRSFYGPEIPTAKDLDSEVEILNLATEGINHPKPAQNSPPFNKNSELATSSEESDTFSYTTTTEADSASSHDELTTDRFAYVTLRPWEFMQQDGASEKQVKANNYQQLHQPSSPGDRVRVVIHNITQITEDDVQNGIIFAGYDDDVHAKIDDRRTIANQTEIIYTVFVNGRPVLASTAANDMKFVTELEVSKMIGNAILLKAEPYLREPQATPLAPATRSGAIGFLDSIQNNAALVIVSSIAILLLLLLLIALLLMGRTKHNRRLKEVKRASSRNDLLAECQSQPASPGTTLDTGRSVGIQNISFEHEHSGHKSNRPAHIHFPGPPNTNSRRGSVTSSDNTSDSSVYCPINAPTADIHGTLSEKANTLFDNHQTRHRSDRRQQYDRAEGREQEDAIYTAVLSEKKRKKGIHKTKRRYLSENRVGSLETSPTQRHQQQSSGEEAVADVNYNDGLLPKYQNFEHAEAFNKDNNYHRNISHHHLHQRQKTLAEFTEGNAERHVTKAINREMIRALQPSEKSSDSGSIGSFLSMASVKTFPKNFLPEPLNRVLEPVFVTYYDNAEDSMSVKPSKGSRKMHPMADPPDATTIATIEGYPVPKAPSKVDRKNSLSDNPDPGVVGPVVWERHKKGLSTDDLRRASMMSSCSPVRDPAAMRNHYEGLLEGAMQMYTSQDDLPMPLPTCNFSNNRKPTQRENRGSSAGVPSSSARPCNHDSRPATAQPDKTPKSNNSTQPPSPNSGAWSGSVHGSHSPLVRPMSAGPFHRPEPLNAGVSDGSRPHGSREELSAAPIIDAIQTELRKLQHKEP